MMYVLAKRVIIALAVGLAIAALLHVITSALDGMHGVLG